MPEPISGRRVCVVGGGVVGLACAWELARRDAEVVVLEAGTLGGGVSQGNAGWICPSLTAPLAAPGMVREGVHQLVRGGGAFLLRPSLDPALLRWLLAFARNCTRSRYEEGVRALDELDRRTIELYDAYVEAGVELELHPQGLVIAGRTEEALAPYRRLARLRGRELEELDGRAAAELEPALDGTALAGALYSRVDRHVRPESLTTGLARSLRGLGAELRERTPVTVLERRGGGWLVRSATDDMAADAVVVAAGLGSAPLLRAQGVRTPLVGARGYSIDVTGDGEAPQHALYLAEVKLAVSPFRDCVRIAGVLELGGRPRNPDLAAAAAPYLAWRPHPGRSVWSGLRPATPTGVPLVGPVPGAGGLYVATGHAMLGVSLAPATAHRLVESWLR